MGARKMEAHDCLECTKVHSRIKISRGTKGPKHVPACCSSAQSDWPKVGVEITGLHLNPVQPIWMNCLHPRPLHTIWKPNLTLFWLNWPIQTASLQTLVLFNELINTKFNSKLKIKDLASSRYITFFYWMGFKSFIRHPAMYSSFNPKLNIDLPSHSKAKYSI